MDAQQLNECATHLREVACVLNHDEVRTAALELAVDYEQEAHGVDQRKQRTCAERPRL